MALSPLERPCRLMDRVQFLPLPVLEDKSTVDQPGIAASHECTAHLYTEEVEAVNKGPHPSAAAAAVVANLIISSSTNSSTLHMAILARDLHLLFLPILQDIHTLPSHLG